MPTPRIIQLLEKGSCKLWNGTSDQHIPKLQLYFATIIIFATLHLWDTRYWTRLKLPCWTVQLHYCERYIRYDTQRTASRLKIRIVLFLNQASLPRASSHQASQVSKASRTFTNLTAQILSAYPQIRISPGRFTYHSGRIVAFLNSITLSFHSGR